MTDRTDQLVRALVSDVRSVRRMRPPLHRAFGWIVLALATMALIAVAHGTRADLPARLQEARFGLALGAAALTGVLAAIATMLAGLPDRSRRWLWLPAPSALAWLTTVTGGCLADWVAMRGSGVPVQPVLECLGILALATAPLSVALFWLLRPLAGVLSRGVIAVGCLAVGSFAAVTLNLVHGFNASAMILAANFGAVVLVTAIDFAVAPAALRRVARLAAADPQRA